jgi:hypothetical protein
MAMPQVVITGWNQGLRKISMTRAIQEHSGLTLSAAKAVTDAVLEGQTVALSVPDAGTAAALARELSSLGAMCHVDPGALAG